MILKNRLEFLDQCIAGERAQYDKILSREIFNTFDRGFDLYKDYIKSKNSITNITCEVNEGEITFHLYTKKGIDDIVSDNMPKRGISSNMSDNGVDLHINLIDTIIS